MYGCSRYTDSQPRWSWHTTHPRLALSVRMDRIDRAQPGWVGSWLRLRQTATRAGSGQGFNGLQVYHIILYLASLSSTVLSSSFSVVGLDGGCWLVVWGGALHSSHTCSASLVLSTASLDGMCPQPRELIHGLAGQLG